MRRILDRDRTVRHRTLTAFASAVLLLAAACAGDDAAGADPATDAAEPDDAEDGATEDDALEPDEDADEGASDDAAADADGASGEPVVLGFSAWPGWFPWQVAEEAGIFDEVGLEVELTWFEGYLDSLNAMAAGQLDANSQTLNDTLASVAAGDDQIIVLANDNSTGNDQIIVREGITTIEELEGARIGIEVGVVDHFLLLLGLEEVGLGPDDVSVIDLETGAAAAQFASGSGDLDAVGVFAPFTTQALERPGSTVLFTSADHPGAIPDHLVVSREMVEERPGDVQLLVDAWFLTLEWMEENPDEALSILAERAGVSEEDYSSYEAGTTLFSVEDNLEAFEPGDDFTSLAFAAEQIADFLVDSDFVQQRPDLDGVFDDRFVRAVAEREGS